MRVCVYMQIIIPRDVRLIGMMLNSQISGKGKAKFQNADAKEWGFIF